MTEEVAEAHPGLHPSLCLLQPDVADAEAALGLLARTVVDQGFAHESFVEALLARERTYPTGLPLPVPVAIPHTDAEHVRRPGLAALVPARPLSFGEMGGGDRTVDVRLVLVLLVTDPAQQVPLLGRLIKALRRPDLDTVLLDDLEAPEALVERFAALLDT